MNERITHDEEKLTFRYTIKFEKEFSVTTKNGEFLSDDIEEEIANRIFYNTEDYLDGHIIDIDDIEMM